MHPDRGLEHCGIVVQDRLDYFYYFLMTCTMYSISHLRSLDAQDISINVRAPDPSTNAS